MKPLFSIAVFIAFALVAPSSYAQSTWDRLGSLADAGRSITPSSLRGFAKGPDEINTKEAAKALAVFNINLSSLAYGHKHLAQTHDDARVDKQIVAGSAAGGTGDPVSMPGLPEILAFAVSSGAVTQTVNQNVVTFSANGDGLYRFLAGQDPACTTTGSAPQNGRYFTDPCTPPSWAHNLAVSAAFNTGNGGSQTLTGQSATDGTTQSALVNINKKDFSSASARYAVINTRSAQSPQSVGNLALGLSRAFSQFSGEPGQKLLAYVQQVLQSRVSAAEISFLEDPDRVSIRRFGACLPAEEQPRRIVDAWACAIGRVQGEIQSRGSFSAEEQTSLLEAMQFELALIQYREPLFDSTFARLREAYIAYLTREALTEKDQVHDPMLTLDYTFSKPPLEHNLHTFTFVYAFSPAKSADNPVTLTANLGLSIYAKAQPTDTKGNSGNLRNLQAAFQFDRAWLVSPTQVPVQVSLGGYFQYQLKSGLINIPSGSTLPGTNIAIPADAATLLAPKGLIAVAEAKVTLHVPHISTPIPLGFTYSNRTDLLKGSEVRGHIAFNFDAVSLANAKRTTLD